MCAVLMTVSIYRFKPPPLDQTDHGISNQRLCFSSLASSLTKRIPCPPSPTKRISCSLNRLDVSLTYSKLGTPKPAHSRSESTTTTTAAATALPILPLLLSGFSFQNDAGLLGLAPALRLPLHAGGIDALAHVHGHLLLLVDGRLGAEGLDAEVEGLLADAAGGEGLWLGGGGRGCGQGGGEGEGPVWLEEMGFGNEAAELEVLGEEGGGVFGGGG